MNGQPVRVLLVEDNLGDARLLHEAMEEAHAADFELKRVAQLSDALKHLGAEPFDAVLLDLSLPDSHGLDTFLRARAQAPKVPILVLTGLDDEKLAITAVKEGAQDYLVKGEMDGSQLARSIHYAIARQRALVGQIQQARPGKRGRVLGLFGAKGGVGVTTVALNLATLLSRKDNPAIVLELWPSHGTLAEQTARTPVDNLWHLLELDTQQIDARALLTRLVRLPYGPGVLYGPQTVEDFKEIPPERARAIVEGLAGIVDYTVIDFPFFPSPATQEAVSLCDFVALVVEPDPACLSAGNVQLKLLQSWGVGGGQVGGIVVNRTISSPGLKVNEIKSLLGCPIIGVIPAAADAFAIALKTGVPLVHSQPNHVAAMSLAEIARRLELVEVVAMAV